jgi:ATP-dependent helicase/DNAse subunit B
MQLPVYLYLIHYGRVFSNPIFTGIYYQNILFPYPTWSEKLEKEKKERTYLQGYSTDNVDILERFDSTYQDSELIRSMKYTPEKGFGAYSKVLDDDTLYQMIQYTKDMIDKETNSILDAKFPIQPKIYAGDNIACKYCEYRDLCYVKEKDYKYLDKVEDLSFLGGEE